MRLWTLEISKLLNSGSKTLSDYWPPSRPNHIPSVSQNFFTQMVLMLPAAPYPSQLSREGIVLCIVRTTVIKYSTLLQKSRTSAKKGKENRLKGNKITGISAKCCIQRQQNNEKNKQENSLAY